MSIFSDNVAGFFEVDTTDDEYPANNEGANTSTAGSSTLVNANYTIVFGVDVTVAASGESCIIQNHAGTAIPGLAVSTTSTGYHAFGPNGCRVTGGISATLSDATTARATVFYTSLG